MQYKAQYDIHPTMFFLLLSFSQDFSVTRQLREGKHNDKGKDTGGTGGNIKTDRHEVARGQST